MSFASLLIEFVIEWVLGKVVPTPKGWSATAFEVGERLEQHIGGVPFRQGWVASITTEQEVEFVTVEWDDGTRTRSKAEDVLRSAKRIHPLAPRLERLGRP